MFAQMAGQKRVMIVEDDLAIAGLLEIVVESEGYQALPVYDGETAVVKAHSEHPDLITLDLALPRKDGRAVLHDLITAEDTRDIPVIVVSAYANNLSRDDQRRVAYVVTKPFDVDDLLGKIKRVLKDKRGGRA
jgi:DNA-binding response OmpR family regulator